MAFGRKVSKSDTPEVSDAPVVGASTGVFLGTLRSEFDEPAALPSAFARLLADVEATLAQFQAGELDQHATAVALGEHTFTDLHGGQWTVGATTRRWYRRTSGG
jgi:hypothetical protein